MSLPRRYALSLGMFLLILLVLNFLTISIQKKIWTIRINNREENLCFSSLKTRKTETYIIFLNIFNNIFQSPLTSNNLLIFNFFISVFSKTLSTYTNCILDRNSPLLQLISNPYSFKINEIHPQFLLNSTTNEVLLSILNILNVKNYKYTNYSFLQVMVPTVMDSQSKHLD